MYSEVIMLMYGKSCEQPDKQERTTREMHMEGVGEFSLHNDAT